jgi:hypothetical protein
MTLLKPPSFSAGRPAASPRRALLCGYTEAKDYVSVTADVGLHYERIGEGVCAVISADVAGVAMHGRAGLGSRKVRGDAPCWGGTRSTSPCSRYCHEYSKYPL